MDAYHGQKVEELPQHLAKTHRELATAQPEVEAQRPQLTSIEGHLTKAREAANQAIGIEGETRMLLEQLSALMAWLSSKT